ncbi:hypothetical protein [Salinimicrobium xinjiangense]|uniref:hypothetical protein n=1 Tax=Salinimicrobium xinjiangense TaxID=438596 RepID=UPI00040C5059|nr:hypothetical protein [Salinimicrobium xinjiangense]
MAKEKTDIFKFARELGYRSAKKESWKLVEWLREEKNIHVEVGSMWDELNNQVESYFFTVTAPVNRYYIQPIYCTGGKSYDEMLLQGLEEALLLLKNYTKQKNIKVSDDMIVIAYLKGYGDKNRSSAKNIYQTNIERYAYFLGKQGDYIEEGLTEDDIVILVRNELPEAEKLRLE